MLSFSFCDSSCIAAYTLSLHDALPVARAEDALARRDLEEARGVAEQAAGVHPHDPAVHLLLGRLALAPGRSLDAGEELMDGRIVGVHARRPLGDEIGRAHV